MINAKQDLGKRNNIHVNIETIIKISYFYNQIK